MMKLYPHTAELNLYFQISTSMLSVDTMYATSLVFSFKEWDNHSSLHIDSSRWVWIKWKCEDLCVSSAHFAIRRDDGNFETTLWHFFSRDKNCYFDIILNRLLGGEEEKLPYIIIHRLEFRPLKMAKSLNGTKEIQDESTFDQDFNHENKLPGDYEAGVKGAAPPCGVLSQISLVRPHFSATVTAVLRSISFNHPDIPPRAAALALSTLVSLPPASDSDLIPAYSEMTEGLFLSLCFGSSVPVRHRLLLDAERFDVRPSILLTVFIGFTKDPYPYVRKAALDGLIGLCNRVVFKDGGMIKGCYLRGVELLSDTEDCARCSAVRMVTYANGGNSLWKSVKIKDIEFLGTLVDMNSSIRITSRKVLRLTKFDNMPMFKLAVDNLIHSLEMYPQDEPDVLFVIFGIGRNHGRFAASITEETFLEMEPCLASNWDFNSSRTAANLTLAISASLSHEMQQHLYIIPPTIFSYAVTMLGRISNGLTEVMDRSTLLSYLSHCSSSTGPHHIEAEDDVATEVNGLYITFTPGNLEYDNIKFVLANIAEIWQPLTKLGCTSELLTVLRHWKEELRTHITDSCQPDSILTFTLQYLRVMKLLSKAWWHTMCPLDPTYNRIGDVGYILQKLETKLRELRYRFIGLSKEEELHLEELTLVVCTLRLSIFYPPYHASALKKLFMYKETSTAHSRFLTELMKTLQKDESNPYHFREPLELFFLKQLELSRNLRWMRAELDIQIQDNDWVKPIPFVAGLPVGIPLKMKLHNTPLLSKEKLHQDLIETTPSSYNSSSSEDEAPQKEDFCVEPNAKEDLKTVENTIFNEDER
ncbi:hypothetical protein E3N88_43372 [Mikania micrantha]|uniref:Uncharacterized protein n=1 Tax=Mikania micrantha TaxID=192012 RepID=A0A5N6LF43_9ASTR|nr:hypothetical protein E3N88_43372 [Mikania micrantha]